MRLEKLIEDLHTIPFLFVGPGLSSRYYHLPNWDDLLKQMVKSFHNNPLAYCSYENDASLKGNEYDVNPVIATHIEKDFNIEWFDNEEIRNLDECYMNKVINGCSPFKAELCNYIKNNSILDKSMIDEITLLQHIAKNSIAEL